MEANDISKICLAVCRCCALSDPALAAAVTRIEGEWGESVSVSVQRCLDVCLENGAFKLNGEMFTLSSEQAPMLEERIRQAVKRQGELGE